MLVKGGPVLHKMNLVFNRLTYNISVLSMSFGTNDDVITTKRCLHYWCFVVGLHQFPSQRTRKGNISCSIFVCLNKPLNKQPRCWLFETSRRSYGEIIDMDMRWHYDFVIELYHRRTGWPLYVLINVKQLHVYMLWNYSYFFLSPHFPCRQFIIKGTIV